MAEVTPLVRLVLVGDEVAVMLEGKKYVGVVESIKSRRCIELINQFSRYNIGLIIAERKEAIEKAGNVELIYESYSSPKELLEEVKRKLGILL